MIKYRKRKNSKLIRRLFSICRENNRILKELTNDKNEMWVDVGGEEDVTNANAGQDFEADRNLNKEMNQIGHVDQSIIKTSKKGDESEKEEEINIKIWRPLAK